MTTRKSAPTDAPTPMDVPASATPVSFRRRLQLPLLLFAIGGLIFFGYTMWSKRETIVFLTGNSIKPTNPWKSFALSNATIPRDEIRGGALKDGIPSLTNPKLLAAADVDFLESDDRVIGVVFGDDARAYPLKILEYHEVVNDHVGGIPLAVTYCPLCDSAAVFDRRHPDGDLEFGISGLLYNSNVLIYNRKKGEGESLWSQLMGTAVSGPNVGDQLKVLPLELTTWADWSARHPESRVLSSETGHGRNYAISAYVDYFSSPNLLSPVKPSDARLPKKTPVLGVWTKNAWRAYPLSAFTDESEPRQFEQKLDDRRFTIGYHPKARSLRIIRDDDGVRWMYAYWFAWYAFHPKTELYNAPAT